MNNATMDGLYDAIAGDSTTTALLDSNTAIYEGQAPPSAAFDYVIIAASGGRGDLTENPDTFVDFLVTVKGVSDTSIDAAGAIADALYSLLDHSPFTVTGWTIYFIAQEAPFRYPEHAPNGTTIYHAGGNYRIRAYS